MEAVGAGVVRLCSTIKKPFILVGNSLLLVAFLSYFDIVHNASDSAVSWVCGLMIFYATWTVCFVALFHTSVKAIRLAASDVDPQTAAKKAKAARFHGVIEKIGEIVCWASLFAASTTLGDILEEDLTNLGRMGPVGVAWTKFLLLLGVCYISVIASKAMNCVAKTVCCFSTLGKVDKALLQGRARVVNNASTYDKAKERAADVLHFTLTSALAWLMAVGCVHAIDKTVMSNTSKGSDFHLQTLTFLWLFTAALSAGELVLHKYMMIDHADAMQTDARAMSRLREMTRNHSKTIIDCVLDLTDQFAVFLPLTCMMFLVIHTIEYRFDSNLARAEAALVFTVIYVTIFSIIAVAAEFLLRLMMRRLTRQYLVVFFDKISLFFSHGINGVLGKLMQYGAKGMMKEKNVKFDGPCSGYVCRAMIFATITIMLGLVFVAIIVILPGDVDLISVELSSDASGGSSQRPSRSGNSTTTVIAEKIPTKATTVVCKKKPRQGTPSKHII